MKNKIPVSCVLLLAAIAVFGTACTDDSAVEVKKTTTFTVTFDSDGGDPVPSQSVARGGSVKAPPLPGKDGYIFHNWFTASGDRWIFQSDPEYMPDPVTGNITLYAKWFDTVPVNVFFYYFPTNYTSDPPEPDASVVVSQLDFLDLKNYAPGRDKNPGYMFQNWYAAEDSVKKTPVSYIMAEQDEYHFIVTWVGAVTVTFNTNRGSPVNDLLVAQGAIISPGDYTTRRSTGGQADLFDGWYLDSTFTIPAPDELEIEYDITLHARWYTREDLQKFAGVWNHPDGKKRYLVNVDLTAWYFNDEGLEIEAVKWRPMTIGSQTFTMNAEGDTLTMDGEDYTKSTETMTPKGVPDTDDKTKDINNRWVDWDNDRAFSWAFTLRTNSSGQGLGTLGFTNGSVTPWLMAEVQINYAADDIEDDNPYVYFLDRDNNHVLLKIRYVIDETVRAERTYRRLGNRFLDQPLLTPGF
jgi:uncharacterized repeat protein (TIGR02543 family)